MTSSQPIARTAWAGFCDVPVDHPGIAALADASNKFTVEAGVGLIEQGEQNQNIYLVLEGEFKVVRYSENGHEIWLADAPKGHLIGEISSLANRNRSSSVIAVTASTVLSIEGPAYLEALSTHGELAVSLCRLLATRLADTSAQVVELVSMPVEARLHAELVRIGTVDPDDSEVYRITQMPKVSDLGDRIHATREATSRAIAKLNKRQLIHRSDDVVTVIAPGALIGTGV
ncbi:MAG: Crp/Fnr family transcriptional regulator [Pseudomonadota bacterium]